VTAFALGAVSLIGGSALFFVGGIMAQAELDIKPLAQQIVLDIKLKNLRQWQWRVRVAMWLIDLAARVMWMKAEVEVEDGA